MNYRGVFFLLGRLLIALALALLAPAAVAWFFDDGVWTAFVGPALLAAVAGIVLQRWNRQEADFPFSRREAFLLVTAAWVTASVIGALPYLVLKGPQFAVDALFESASGFTTTGASVLADVENEPHGLLLWRSLTQWLGGMGIIVLGIAILPKLAIGGMELLGAEAPGPMQEKLTPRIAQTAKYLWGIYALLTGAEVAVLIVLGLPPLEAINHALTTMATGGFSTRNASVASFASPAIELAVTGFMFLAGVNFALHFWWLRGRPRRLFGEPEFRFYCGVLLGASLLLALDLVLVDGHRALDAARLAVFQSTSVVTTTGYATANFDTWPSFSKVLLFLLMFVGGCAGSTGGSVKVVRIMIVAKKLVVDLKRLVQPHAVLPVRIGRRAVPEEIVASVTTFFILFLTLFAAGGLLLGLMGLDMVSAFSASATCLGNIGPGLGAVGPAATYGPLPDVAKLLLVGLMIVGRLELYTVLVLVFMWRRTV
ncbi:MAG TPA: TrkH family potassium uptake protein [Candidatus Polarisedimenticolaceae bacterium]|nr:TrkH family potassium uptake protein [Candidatus Polarisedimenticolaceae bacterium]